MLPRKAERITARRRLTNKEVRKILRFLHTCPGVYVGNSLKTRRFLEAILWMARMGAPWREIPARYGRWNSIYKRFSRWCERGIWKQLFVFFAADPDLEWLLPDTTIIRAHPCAAGAPHARGGQEAQALGFSRGGFTTKIHVVVDALGNPLDFILTPGQRHELTQAAALLAGYQCDYVIADKAYDADDFLALVDQIGAIPVIPATKRRTDPRPHDEHLYKERHLVECFINKIKWFRRIFTRYDKLASRYLSFLFFVSALVWMR